MSYLPRNRYKLGTVKVSEGTGNDPNGPWDVANLDHKGYGLQYTEQK